MSGKAFRIPKIWKYVMAGAAVSLLLLISFAVYINLQWRPYLANRIKEAISTSTDSLYRISFDKVTVNVITGKVSFKKIAFVPDLAVYQRMIMNGSAPRHLFIVEVASLDLERVHPFQVYFRRELELSSVLVNRPRVRMIYRNLPGRKPIVADQRNAYQRLSKYLSYIKVDKIDFHDSDFQYVDKSVKTNQVTQLKNLDIGIAGLLIDSASQFNNPKLYYTDDISVRLDDYAYRTPDSLYDITVKEFSASTRSKNARALDVKLVPRYNEMEFSGRLKSRTSRYHLRFEELQLEGIDFKAFNTDRRLIANGLTISNSNASIFLNKAIAKETGRPTLSFPQIALRRMTLNTRIDSVIIRNARVAYSEYTPQTKMKGMIFFDHIDGTVSNITNDSAALTKNNISRADITGLVMGRGRMNVILDMNLASKRGAFRLNGSVGNMDGQLVNKMLRPLTLVEINEGFIEQMQFQMSGDTLGAKGRLALKYDDLKISLLARNENSRLRKMNIASMAANILVLKNENPSPGESLRHANIRYTRPDSVSFISMVWKGMLGGLKETIGLDPQTQRRVEAKVRELEIIKEEREERREERLKRKEERKQRNRK